MNYKIKGIITAIGDIKTTKLGTAVQQLHFEQEASGRIFYPSALGNNINLLRGFLPGDVAELEFHIKGSVSSSGDFYNNVIIDNLTRL